MAEEKLQGQIEAMLFIYGEPLTFKKLSKILDTKETLIRETVQNIAVKMAEENRGLHLIIDEEKVQLATKPEFGKLLEDTIKGELNEELSSASLETLSIIIYSAPISRAEIEYIRGVNSSFILRSLLIRGLVERESDPKRPNAFVYKPSFEFLKHLGISKTADLPEYEQFQTLIKSLRQPDSDANQQSN